jgi:hypothetical protein
MIITRAMGGIVSFYLFLFISGCAKWSSHEQSNVQADTYNSRRLVIQLQSAEVYRTVTSSFVWSWTISVNVNEGTQDPENLTRYSSFVSALFTVYAQ